MYFLNFLFKNEIFFYFFQSNICKTNVSGTETNSVDYLNYDFPEGAEVLYQGEDGVIYTNPSDSNGEISETATARAVEYSQV